MIGSIKKLIDDRHFGFIGVEGESKDYFFHADSLVNAKFEELRLGDKLEFEVAENNGKVAAINVKRV